MSERYNLKRMLDEIREDQSTETTKHRKLTRDAVQDRVARKRKTRGTLSNEQQQQQ
jgi:hypothetical protein